MVRAGVALALLVVLFGGLQAAPAAALSNGLALTPPMGWDSWNSVGCAVSSDVVERAADAMVSSGMSRAGYRYVVVDDCWMAKNRTAGGELQPDPTRFPKGIKALADYVHAAGLLFGLYETPGDVTCAGNAGSYGHEEQDVATMVRWGIDYLKYDACTYPSMAPDGADATAWLKTGFSKMRDLLAKSGRPVVYSINPTGFTDVAPAPWTWAANIANLWRVGFDHAPCWRTTITSTEYPNVCVVDNLDRASAFLDQSGPGRWNDLDMLEIGNGARDSNPGNVALAKAATGMNESFLSDTEGRSELSIWSMFAAPLMAGNDIAVMSAQTRLTLTNAEVLAVDRDGGAGATRLTRGDGTDLWTRRLANGDRVILLLNPTEKPISWSLDANGAQIPTAVTYALRDLWSHQTVASTDGHLGGTLGPHAVAMYRVSITAPSTRSPHHRGVLFAGLAVVAVFVLLISAALVRRIRQGAR